ncbi:MAG: hypothetical protein KDA93_24560 [Planctomycetaceae bacterium]|nr:hypothetical protein [Planctomycetaceae bacterium]
MTQKPVNTIRRGNIETAIWKNDTEHGPVFNTTFTRCYKDGDELKIASNFGRNDLLRVARLAVLAEAWIDDQGA